VNDQSQPEIATRGEVLALLTAKAREGSTSAMIALERALRQPSALRNEPWDDDDDDELERLLEGD
jgi:hypothetical protein